MIPGIVLGLASSAWGLMFMLWLRHEPNEKPIRSGRPPKSPPPKRTARVPGTRPAPMTPPPPPKRNPPTAK